MYFHVLAYHLQLNHQTKCAHCTAEQVIYSMLVQRGLSEDQWYNNGACTMEHNRAILSQAQWSLLLILPSKILPEFNPLAYFMGKRFIYLLMLLQDHLAMCQVPKILSISSINSLNQFVDLCRWKRNVRQYMLTTTNTRKSFLWLIVYCSINLISWYWAATSSGSSLWAPLLLLLVLAM